MFPRITLFKNEKCPKPFTFDKFLGIFEFLGVCSILKELEIQDVKTGFFK